MMASHAQQALPLEAALAILPSLPRPVLSRLVTRMIEHLDELDGDPDLEGAESEDEPDFSKLPKRERKRRARWYGPGCQIADSDYCNGHDDRGGGWLTPSERKAVRALKQRLAS